MKYHVKCGCIANPIVAESLEHALIYVRRWVQVCQTHRVTIKRVEVKPAVQPRRTT